MSIDISPLAIIASVVGDVIVATSIIGLVRRRRARRVDIPSRDYNPLYPRHGFTVLDPADVGEPRSTFAARVLNDTASRGSFFAKRADEV